MINWCKHISIKKAAFFGCFFVLLSCENDVKQVEALGKKEIGVEEAYNIESYLSEAAIVKAKLTAPVMLRTQADTPVTEFPKTLHVDFYNDSTQIESQMNAKYGRYLQEQSKVLLRDSVVVFNVSGDTLFTNELYWDQDAERFYTDKPVSIHKPNNEIIDGIGMSAHQDLKDVTIFKIQPNTRLYVADSTLPQ